MNCNLWNISKKCYLNKEGAFLNINILTYCRYRVGKAQANTLMEKKSGRNEMNLPKFEFIQPHSLQEACSILGERYGKAAILAGGTALVVASHYRLSKPTVYIRESAQNTGREIEQ